MAILPMPYGYYTLLRLAATAVFVWAAVASYGKQHTTLPWTFGLLALVFNPLVPVYLPKAVWVIIDLGAGLLVLWTARALGQPAETAAQS